MKRLALAALVALTLPACFSPNLGDEPFACGAGNLCPENYVCVGATGLCTRAHPSDAGAIDASNGFGRFSATWNVTLNGDSANCAEVSAVTFEISALRDGDSNAQVFQYLCASMSGTTDPIPQGDYTITIRMLDLVGNQLNQDVTVDKTLGKGQTIDLGNYVFAFQNR